MPHSRFNEIDRAQFEAAGLRVLVESEEAGVHLAVSEDGFRLVFFQGHPEYDTISLLKEYKREVSASPPANGAIIRPSRSTISTCKAAPSWTNTARACSPPCARPDRRPSSRRRTSPPRLDNTWHDTAEAVIGNWMGMVYQITNSDRRLPFMPGVDPSDPLRLFGR